jgi:hypothetical protein
MKIMRNVKAGMVALLALGLSACAVTPTPSVKIDSSFYKDDTSSVGVYFIAPEKVDTYLDGASCLLCYAAAAAANGHLTKHIQTMNVNDMTEVKADIISILQEKGKKVELVNNELKLNKLKTYKPKTVGFADVDYTTLKDAVGVDKLLIVQIEMLGAQRLYSGYVPTSSPAGAVSGKMYMVDLATNKLELYQVINERVAVNGEWDEPASFPGVTAAYFQAVEQAKMFIKQQL